MYRTNGLLKTSMDANGSPIVGNTANTIPIFSRRFGSWQLSVQRLPFSLPELTQRYDRAAPVWRKMLNRFNFPRAYETLLRNVLSENTLVETGQRLRFLDCGVGTGALSIALNDVLLTPCSLAAIDISSRMLEQARRNLYGSKMEVLLRQGDVRKLPYADGAFDMAMTAHVLEHLVDPGIALKEMVRVLKPGGLLVACITRRSAMGMLVHLKWRTHSVTPAQAESWLLKSGLENVQCVSLGDGVLCRRMSVAFVGRKPR